MIKLWEIMYNKYTVQCYNNLNFSTLFFSVLLSNPSFLVSSCCMIFFILWGFVNFYSQFNFVICSSNAILVVSRTYRTRGTIVRSRIISRTPKKQANFHFFGLKFPHKKRKKQIETADNRATRTVDKY